MAKRNKKMEALGHIQSKIELLRTLPLDKAIKISKDNVCPTYVRSRVSLLRKKGQYKDIRVSVMKDAAYLWRDNLEN